MREKRQIQMPLLTPAIAHPHAEELCRISKVLESITTISEMVWQDLTRDAHGPAGACGMSAEQVVRAAIVKNMNGFSYDELAFHLIDSRCYRHFCRIGFAQEGFSKSTLHATIKALRPGRRFIASLSLMVKTKKSKPAGKPESTARL